MAGQLSVMVCGFLLPIGNPPTQRLGRPPRSETGLRIRHRTMSGLVRLFEIRSVSMKPVCMGLQLGRVQMQVSTR